MLSDRSWLPSATGWGMSPEADCDAQLMYTPESDEIVALLGRAVSDRSAARAVAEGDAAPAAALWDLLVSLGIPGMALPTALGGSGLTITECAAVVEMLGRTVAPAPVVSAMLASTLLSRHADGNALAARLVAGERIGVAWSARSGLAVDLERVVRDGNGARLSGSIPDLVEADALDVVLLWADGGWWSLSFGDPGIEREIVPTLDPTRPFSRLTLADATATPIGGPDRAELDAQAWTLLACEALGVARAALDLARQYALDRVQFGQPIGRFQAIKHKLTEMLVRIEGVQSAIWGAIRSSAADGVDLRQARVAKAVATATAVFATAEAVQIHGAMGCTWEHDLHLLQRRAKLLELACGPPETHFQAIAEELLGEQGADPAASRPAGRGLDLGFDLSAEDRAFIDEFRAWLNANATPERLGRLRGRGLVQEQGDTLQRRKDWQAAMAEGGWAGVHWPVEHGGRGATFTQQVLYHSEIAARGLPPLIGNRGLSLVGPTLFTHGNGWQRADLLEGTRRADVLWAGGFSERGAGSDLASLATRGTIEGDEIVIQGHKIWTSQAHIADWMFTLVRTGAARPKHAGISCVLIPLGAPGVTIRPVRRNNGDYHFNEVFLDEVRLPRDHVVGALNDGWRVARTTLAHEHFTNFLGTQSAQANVVARIVRALAAREAAEGAPLPALRSRVAQAWANTMILRLHGLRNIVRVVDGDDPGAEGSIQKLVGQEEERRLYELMLDVRGAAGLVWDRWAGAYLSTKASTIGGGTSEVHRNKIAERVLGMPRDLWAGDEEGRGDDAA